MRETLSREQKDKPQSWRKIFVKDSQNGRQMWEMVLYGTAVLGTWLRALVKTHRTVRRRLDFTVCKFLKISQAVGGIDGVQTEPNEDKGI